MRNTGWFSRCFMLSALIMALVLAGCAEKGPILLTVGYQPPETKAVASKKVAVAVSLVKDTRNVGEAVLGTRTIPDGMRNDFIVQGTVATLVTAALKDALKARGLDVKEAPAWDLTAEGMKAEGAELLFGGEIKTLRLDSTAATFNTKLSASVQIMVVVGDVVEKKIIRTLDVKSKLEQEILYSEEKLQEALSEALSSALDQIFQDDVLKSKLRLHEGTVTTSPTPTSGS
jgi:uncharacterized lipoprotein YajG